MGSPARVVRARLASFEPDAGCDSESTGVLVEVLPPNASGEAPTKAIAATAAHRDSLGYFTARFDCGCSRSMRASHAPSRCGAEASRSAL